MGRLYNFYIMMSLCLCVCLCVQITFNFELKSEAIFTGLSRIGLDNQEYFSLDNQELI